MNWPKIMSFKELCQDKNINEKVIKVIHEHANQTDLSRKEIPTKIQLCSDEWTPDSGLVTAALKLRRKNIEEFYKNEINKLYEN